MLELHCAPKENEFMKIGVIGTGRMGRILAERMRAEHEVLLYDKDPNAASAAAVSLQLNVLPSMVEVDVGALVLAVPETEVKGCMELLLKHEITAMVFSVATNISREILMKMSGGKVRCLNVKIIGHAGEMSRGARPVVVVDQGEAELVEVAGQIFGLVGSIVMGDADMVKQINLIATQEALRAAVAIEKGLLAARITDPDMICGALSQVAPGVLKAFAEDDLGPFARGVVCSLRDKSS